VPKKVDHEQRRRHIVEALLRIAGARGLDAVSLREVAQEAGVSMGAVQHYFTSKDEMLLYAMRHWLTLGVHQRFTARVRQRLGGLDADARDVLCAFVAEYLPHDDESRADTKVALAFVSRAADQPAVVEAVRPALTGLVETLRGVLASAEPAERQVDKTAEAHRLVALVDGLRLHVLAGSIPYEDALALACRHIDQIILPSAPTAGRPPRPLP